MRHLMVDCPNFTLCRGRLLSQHGLAYQDFLQLPRVATKTGWATFASAQTTAKRTTWQIMLVLESLA